MSPPKAGKERRNCMLAVFNVLDKVLSDHLIWKVSGYPVTSTCDAIRWAHVLRVCNVKAMLKWL